MKNELLNIIDKLHTTKLGVERIKRNLNLENCDVIKFCSRLIANKYANIYKNGKNYYVEIDDIIITINSYSYTIITAHKTKQS